MTDDPLPGSGAAMTVQMLWSEQWPACAPGECSWEYGADSCQAYGQSCGMEGLSRQEFACHASVCRCGACPLFRISRFEPSDKEVNDLKDGSERGSETTSSESGRGTLACESRP